jgi:hypothetical protein
MATRTAKPPRGFARNYELQLIAAEREHIYRLLHEGRLGDAARRRIEQDLDLEEARVRRRSSDPQVD